MHACIHRRESFRAFDENVEKVRKSELADLILNGEVVAIKGRNRVEKAVIKQEGKKLEKRVDAIIIAIGLVPNNESFKHLGLRTDERGFIMTDTAQRTNIEGIFAVGDITYVGLRLNSVAAAHGAIASHHIHISKNLTGQEKLGSVKYNHGICQNPVVNLSLVICFKGRIV
ncbi:MAG: NAD(P)/FAD-dependent oxidoreductase [Candidatus Bathyarchaeota archaeon]|nr:NAD(P)/FAD-dependent oxidoreductase [Candidatus Bathyarchaeota archaeon]